MRNITEYDDMEQYVKERKLLRKIIKIALWMVGIWLLILGILQIAVSPKVLSGIVDKYAAEYIDGDLSFGNVRLRMYRHFPNIGLSIEDCSITYPAERFDSLETAGPQGKLLFHGTGEQADTLISFKRFSAGINIGALAFGKIKIPHISIIQPRIFAHSYDSLNANWNIFRMESQEDTTETELPPISIGRIRLLKHPHIVYTDSRDTIFAVANISRMSFDGKLKSRQAEKNKIELSVDSMLVAGRIGADTVSLKLDRLHMHEHEDHLDIQAGAQAHLATRSFGRMSIPVSIFGTVGFPKDTVRTYRLHGFRADIASIPIVFDADLIADKDTTGIRCDFSIEECEVSSIVDGFVKNIIPQAKDLKTDARISLKGNIEGPLGGSAVPDINATLSIPMSSSSHKALKHDIRLGLEAEARTDTAGRLNLKVDGAEISTYGLQFNASAAGADLLGEDPRLDLDGHFKIAIDSLATFLPETEGLTAEGNLSADIQGSMLLSQANIYNFAQADLDGNIISDRIRFCSQADSIDLVIDSLDIRIAPETIQSKRDPKRSFRLLGINGKVDNARITLQENLSFSGKGLTISARNSADAFSDTDTTRVHPLSGTLKAAGLSLKDTEGLTISLNNTSNSFRMMPKRGQPDIPVISVTSDNKNIILRDKSNRVILTDANVEGKAALNTADRRQRRKVMLDSLAKVYPDVPYDSLFAHYRATRQSRELPEWLKEEDFRKKDIKVELDQSIAKYFREWDIEGTLGIRTGIVITPYLPLRNILRGAHLDITNDEIRLDSLKLLAGNSEIMAKGGISGLRRALFGRAPYDVSLDLSTGKMEADKLLAALDAGSSFNPDNVTEDMSEASDAEFLKMVVTDTLDTTSSETLIVVPGNVNARISIDGKNISYSDLRINDLTSELTMKERCIQILDTRVNTNMGKAEFEAFYSTRTKQDISTGFNFSLIDVTSEKVISMMPAMDTIMPLLKSFKGLINCELAATANLDTCMNIVIPSLNGVARIGGNNLTISENEMFTDLAKKLKFKDNKEATIQKMTVEGVIRDSKIEIFPFIVDVDRYTLALSGLQNFDMSYKYHVSVIRSPMVFKVGVDLYGPDYDSMKFKIGKAKYKNKKIPVFTSVIDQTKINLIESIRNIYERGVDVAIKENEKQTAIETLKKEIGYVNAAEEEMEELSEEEMKELEKQDESNETNNAE